MFLKRNVKVRVNVKSLPPYVWNLNNMYYVVRGFGNLIEMDVETKNEPQYVEQLCSMLVDSQMVFISSLKFILGFTCKLLLSLF